MAKDAKKETEVLVEAPPVDAEKEALKRQLALLQGKLEEKIASDKHTKSGARTEGKLPIHEIIGAPTREATVVTLQNGTKRVDL
ncbi:MAG: hypothetical protein ACRCZI_11975 [Cetobacterium sp.]